MSVERTQRFLDERGSGLQVIETDADTSTVQTAALALGVQPAQIAKTLALRAGEDVLLLVTRGDARLDNRKFRQRFGSKPRMLNAEETQALTGQPVGGVSPFGHSRSLSIYCDTSMRELAVVYPAAGTRSSAVRVTPDQLADICQAEWVDVCRVPLRDDGE